LWRRRRWRPRRIYNRLPTLLAKPRDLGVGGAAIVAEHVRSRDSRGIIPLRRSDHNEIPVAHRHAVPSNDVPPAKGPRKNAPGAFQLCGLASIGEPVANPGLTPVAQSDCCRLPIWCCQLAHAELLSAARCRGHFSGFVRSLGVTISSVCLRGQHNWGFGTSSEKSIKNFERRSRSDICLRILELETE
jgi:hypothetical protein